MVAATAYFKDDGQRAARHRPPVFLKPDRTGRADRATILRKEEKNYYYQKLIASTPHLCATVRLQD
jgi:hypothetical protein